VTLSQRARTLAIDGLLGNVFASFFFICAEGA